MKTKVLSGEILAIVLCEVPFEKDIRDLEKQLNKIAREEKDRLFGEYFPVHPSYGDSKSLSEDLMAFAVGGGIVSNSRLAPQAHVHRVYPGIQGMAKRASAHLDNNELQYLKRLGKKIELL